MSSNSPQHPTLSDALPVGNYTFTAYLKATTFNQAYLIFLVQVCKARNFLSKVDHILDTFVQQFLESVPTDLACPQGSTVRTLKYMSMYGII